MESGSGSLPEMVIRARNSPVVSQQACSDDTRLRSSQETNPWLRVRIAGALDGVQTQLLHG